MSEPNAKEFYDNAYKTGVYANRDRPQDHRFYKTLREFLSRHDLAENSRSLEIGCGRGAFQDMVDNYWGVDYSSSAAKFHRKNFVNASATDLPFEDSFFDCIWTYATLEHIPNPEKALFEIERVLKPGGVLLFHAAWSCRPWRAHGYPVRPYSDFNLTGKLIKFSILFRDSLVWRSSYIFPKRTLSFIQSRFMKVPSTLRYKKLKPNFKIYWMGDSDAVNSIDIFEVLSFFVSRNWECHNYPDLLSKFFVKTGHLELRKPNQ